MIIKEQVIVQKPFDKYLKESFQVEEIMSMNFKTLLTQNGGNTNKTLADLNEIMSRIQGTDNKIERKAYFKAKKFHQQLVEHTNTTSSQDMDEQIKNQNKKK